DLLTVSGTTIGEGLEATKKRVFDGEGVGSPFYLGTGDASFECNVTATSFTGDGSNLTGVTAEWDGTHNSDSTFGTENSSNALTWTIWGSGSPQSYVKYNQADGQFRIHSEDEEEAFKISTSDDSQFLQYHADLGNLKVHKGMVSASKFRIIDDNAETGGDTGDEYTFASYGEDSGGEAVCNIEMPMHTKAEVVFKATGEDDLVMSADNGTFTKGDGSKGGIALGDTETSMTVDGTAAFTATEDRVQYATQTLAPTNPAEGDVYVDNNGQMYFAQ
ncbi:MAG: hypothetical protein QF535_20120, partial [Anaerolineales bacterium]|nr:hypothetical protein [Anaerolineales bacterium]